MGGYVPYMTVLKISLGFTVLKISRGSSGFNGFRLRLPPWPVEAWTQHWIKGVPWKPGKPRKRPGAQKPVAVCPIVSGKIHMLFFTKDQVVLMKPRCLSDPYALAPKKATHQVSSGSHSCWGSWSRPPVCAAATATLQRRRSAFFSWPKFWWTKPWSTSSGHSSIIHWDFLGISTYHNP